MQAIFAVILAGISPDRIGKFLAGEKEKANATQNGEYVNYSNTFFRDFYSTLVKGTSHANWFSP